MAREFRGKIPRVPIDADTSKADQKIERLFQKIKNVEHIKIDADVSQAQRRLETLVKRNNSQMSSTLINNALKDFKMVLGAMKTEFENNGMTSIFGNLERTCDMVESRFANLNVSIGSKQFSGLEKILNNFSGLEAITDFSFDSIVPSQDVKNSEEVLNNIKAAKKEVKTIGNQVDYVIRTLNKNTDTSLSEDKLQKYKDKIKKLQETLSGFSEIDDPVLQNSLFNAIAKTDEAMNQINSSLVKVKDNAIEAQKEVIKATEAVAKTQKKASGIKFREFTQEEYDAHLEKYEQDHDGEPESLYEIVDILRKASQFGTQFSVDLQTSCKRATTAVKRFFSAIDPAKYPAIASWEEAILESVQNGVFSEKSIYNGMYTGEYAWGVEALDEDSYYVYLNLLDIAKEKESEYSVYLQEEFKKRDEGLKKENELLVKISQKYKQLGELHKNEPKWDSNNQISSIQDRLTYYEQEKTLLQDIADLQKELFAIPAQYRGGDAKEHIHYYQEGLPLGEYGNSTLQDNERAITIYQRELESAIKQQKQLTGTVKETSKAREREADATEKATAAKTKYYEIDEKSAKLSKQMRSFDDYKAGSATASYRSAVDEIAKIVEEKKAQFPDQSDKLDELFDRYARNLANFINRDNQIGAQYPSVMISGAGNYNTKKHNRQMASWGKNYQYYDEKVLPIKNRIRSFGSTGTIAIRNDESDALEKLEAKLEYMKYWHEIMVEVNKYYRKNKTFEGFEGVEADEFERIKTDLATMKQVGMYDIPYPPYALSNDNQNIKRIEGRIAELKRLKDNEGLKEENDIYKLWTDKQDMRIRISFEMGKPEQEIIDMLRGKSFKWSPKNDAWQRQLTDNAVRDTKRLQEALHEFYGITSVSDTQSNIPAMKQLQGLMTDLKNKYGESSFDNIFGKTISSFGELNASNAIELYDALIAKEKEYIAQCEREAEVRRKVAPELAKFAQEQNQVLNNLINYTEDSAKEINKIVADFYNKIQNESMSATEAIKGFTLAIQEYGKAAGILKNNDNIISAPTIETVSTNEPEVKLFTKPKNNQEKLFNTLATGENAFKSKSKGDISGFNLADRETIAEALVQGLQQGLNEINIVVNNGQTKLTLAGGVKYAAEILNSLGFQAIESEMTKFIQRAFSKKDIKGYFANSENGHYIFDNQQMYRISRPLNEMESKIFSTFTENQNLLDVLKGGKYATATLPNNVREASIDIPGGKKGGEKHYIFKTEDGQYLVVNKSNFDNIRKVSSVIKYIPNQTKNGRNISPFYGFDENNNVVAATAPVHTKASPENLFNFALPTSKRFSVTNDKPLNIAGTDVIIEKKKQIQASNEAAKQAQQQADAEERIAQAAEKTESKNAKLTSSYKGLADAVEKYVEASKKLWAAYDKGEDFSKFAEERNTAIENIVSLFPTDDTLGIFSTLSQSGYRMLLQSKEMSSQFAKDGAEATLKAIETNLTQAAEQIRLAEEEKLAEEDSAKNIIQLVDNYGQSLDKVNNKLMQGVKLLNEQAQVIRLFHNSPNIFDAFDSRKSGTNQGQALGFGHYLALRQNGEFNNTDYGRYQTQWYANVQNAFKVGDKISSSQAASIIDKFLADRAEGFKQHMLSKLLDGDVVNAVKDIADESKTVVGEIFSHIGYDAIMDGAQINVFDPSKIYRANDSVLDISTKEFTALEELQKKIWEQQSIIENANRQIRELSNPYIGKTEDELNGSLFTEIIFKGLGWKRNVAKIASAFKELTGKLPESDDISEESMQAMVENYEFSKQNLQEYQEAVAEHQSVVSELTAQFNAQKAITDAITQSYLNGDIEGIVGIETQAESIATAAQREEQLQQQIEANTQKKQEQAKAAGEAAKQTQKQADAENAVGDAAEKANKSKNDKPKGKKDINNTDDAEDKIARIVQKDTESALKLLRDAKNSKSPVIDLSGIYDVGQLEKEFSNAAQNAATKDGYEVVAARIRDNVAMVKIYNNALETAITQEYQMQNALDGTSAKLQHVRDTYQFNIKKLTDKSKEFDKDFEQRFAQAQINNLIASLKGHEYSGKANLESLAGNIIDEESLKKFNTELKIAKVDVATLSKQISHEMNTFESMSKKMDNASERIAHLRNEIKSFSGIEGIGKLKKHIGEMWSASDDYKSTKDLNEQAKAYERYKKAEQAYNADKVLVQDRKKEAEAIAQLDSKMKNANIDLQTMLTNLSRLGNIFGADKLLDTLSQMEAAVNEFNKVTTLEGKKFAFDKYNAGLDEFTSKMKNLKAIQGEQADTQKEINAIAQLDLKMRNASTEIDTMRLKLDGLGNVNGITKAKAMLDAMTAAVKEYNAAQDKRSQEKAYNEYNNLKSSFDSHLKYINEAKKQQAEIDKAWKDKFQKNYQYTGGKTADDQTTLNSMSDFYKQEEERAKQFNNNIKSIYDRLVATVKEINSLDTKMNSLTFQDKGSGLYGKTISSLQSRKSELVADLRSLTDEINNALSLNPASAESGLSQFFKDARVQAALTSEEIQKFDNLLRESDEIKFNFGAKFTAQIQPIIEKIASLKKMIADGFIDKNSDITKNVLSIDTTLSSKLKNFTENPTAFGAVDVMKYVKDILTYIETLYKASQAEAKYFSDKTKYAQDTTIHNMAQQATESTKKIESVQKRLEAAARLFAKESGSGDAFITKFIQGADGISKLDFSVFDTATNSLRNFRMEMGSVSDGMYITETTVNKTLSSIQAADKQMQSMSNLIVKLGQSGVDINIDTATGKVLELLQLLEDLKRVTKGDITDQNIIQTLLDKSKLTTSEVEKLYKQMLKMDGAINNKSVSNFGKVDLKADMYTQATNAIKEFASTFPNATLQIGNLNNATGKLPFTITSASGAMKSFEVEISSVNGQMTLQEKGVKQLGSSWDKLKSGISSVGKQFMTALVGYNVFFKALSTIKQGIGYVKEIDLAMTELKKVTDESEASYSRFLQTASKTSGEIGSTVSDFTDATSNFARLGYSMEESAEMAKTAIVYKNVADGLDTVEESTDSIISTMKAFGIESSDTMGIIDRFNEVGNNFAITSAGIGEALQRSASALYEAGNTIDESIGLVTAAM